MRAELSLFLPMAIVMAMNICIAWLLLRAG
jgi:hypothetical protein